MQTSHSPPPLFKLNKNIKNDHDYIHNYNYDYFEIHEEDYFEEQYRFFQSDEGKDFISFFLNNDNN